MIFTTEEILETVRMIQLDHLDIRTITLGIDLLDCRRDGVKETVRLLSEKLKLTTDGFLDTVNKVGVEYGIPIVNKRVAITPVSLLLFSTDMEEYIYLAEKLDGVAKDIGLDFIGGYTCFLEYEVSQSDYGWSISWYKERKQGIECWYKRTWSNKVCSGEIT